DVPGAELWVNDARAGSLPLARPLRLEAGTAVIEVRAAGYAPVRRPTVIEPGGSAREAVHLVALGPPEQAPPPAPSRAVLPAAPRGRSRVLRADPAMRNAGFVVLGAGLLGLAAGSYFGVVTFQKKSQRDAQCVNGCSAQGVAFDGEARALALRSTAWLVAGAVGAWHWPGPRVGVTLALDRRSRRHLAARPGARPGSCWRRPRRFLVKLPLRFPALGRVAAVLVVLDGCAAVAGLGDPKQLGASSNSDTPEIYAAEIAVGSAHACATVTVGPGSAGNGGVRCWGSNSAGELGTDPSTVTSSSTPLPVEGLAQMASLALGAGSSCAISDDRYLSCWGHVPSETPSGVHREHPAPAYQPSVVDLFAKPVTSVSAASLDDEGGCLVEDTSLVCWGALAFSAGRDAGADGGAAVTEPGFQYVAVGGASACAVASPDVGGEVDCWGDDTFGQAGGGVGGMLTFPSPIGLSGVVRQISFGADFACALLGDGTVSCWGDNSRGQLGPDGPAGSSATPVAVTFFDGFTASALALGDHHACAVMTDPDETVECWGDDSRGQLGVGPSGPARSATTVKVMRVADGGSDVLPHVQHIAAGGGTTCVVRINDPLVSCWGANESGQAGQPPARARVDYATPIPW
ncbi:MAG: RCC1 domain-containing protein, partial [Polyangiaceae bacterium]